MEHRLSEAAAEAVAAAELLVRPQTRQVQSARPQGYAARRDGHEVPLDPSVWQVGRRPGTARAVGFSSGAATARRVCLPCARVRAYLRPRMVLWLVRVTVTVGCAFVCFCLLHGTESANHAALDYAWRGGRAPASKDWRREKAG